MTSKERIEELLNCYGETLEDLPKRPYIGFVYSEEDLQDANNIASVWSFGEGFHDCSSLVLLDFICHQGDMIEKLVKTLESANQTPIRCKDCKNYDPLSHCGDYCSYWRRGTKSDAYCSHAEKKTVRKNRTNWIEYGTLWVNHIDNKVESEKSEESNLNT